MLRVETSVRQDFSELLSQLRSARRAAGLPQRSLAARLDVSNTSLADWETGKDDPTMAHLIRWATELGFRLAIVDPRHSPAVSCVELEDDESWEQHEMRRLAAALWTRRRSRKMSQTALADRVGVGRISMQRWESAQVFPRPIAFLAWAGALECSVALHESDSDCATASASPRVSLVHSEPAKSPR
ncbi:MAG: transcriptional regulator, partial [Catenulispora sp.]|nr:transcriptional regulator [Catenulispora sp.]